ncbi:MAG: chloride channel protein [Cyclobacteriaceae bacterium]
MQGSGLITKLLVWRIKHISDKSFVLILSGMTGTIAGIAAVILSSVVHYIQHFLITTFPHEEQFWAYLFLPLIGIFSAFILTKYVFRDVFGHGVSKVLYFISKGSSIMSKRSSFIKMVTSALTVGFGASVGLEAPIVVTGSSIGSNIGRLAHLNYKKRTILIGCGAAGAIAGIFNSPVAGLIFSAEVILAEVTVASFIPLLIASVCGSTISLILLGDNTLFSVHLNDVFEARSIPYYLALGVLCGLVATFFTRTNYAVERLIKKVKSEMLRALIGGLMVGAIVLFFLPLFGEGYDAVKALIADDGFRLLDDTAWIPTTERLPVLLLFVVALILFSTIGSALTIGAGGSGGVFAPSLLIGALSGFGFSKLITMVGNEGTLSVTNFTLVGMCGVMSGVLHAPLTAIFLIAEISGGYTLFIPLMLVSAIAYITISAFEPHSLYTKRLIERGDLLNHDKDKQMLSLLDINKLVQKDCLCIHENANLRDLTELVKKSHRNMFPVVDDGKKLKGVVLLDDIRQIMFDEEKLDKVYVQTIMTSQKDVACTNDTMETIMGKFERTGYYNIAVVDQEDKYVGFVSRGVLFNAYRHKVIRSGKE